MVPAKAPQINAVPNHMKRHSRNTLRVWRPRSKYLTVSVVGGTPLTCFSFSLCSHGEDAILLAVEPPVSALPKDFQEGL